MMIRIARFIFVVCIGIAAGCAQAPVSPSPVPSPTPSPAQPLAPQAVLRVSPGVDDPLGFAGYTPFVFDGSASTGDGLAYRIDFGDGQSADAKVATHVVQTTAITTARLTVTDRFGRTAVVEQAYSTAEVAQAGVRYWLASRVAGTFLKLSIRRDGASLSGSLQMGSADPAGRGFTLPFSGSLTRDRDVILRTLDGSIEMSGTLEWRDPATINFVPSAVISRVGLRMTIRGGPADGQSVLMVYAEAY